MTVIHNLGFPRIGAKRELKFAQEAYWKGETTAGRIAGRRQSAARPPLAEPGRF